MLIKAFQAAERPELIEAYTQLLAVMRENERLREALQFYLGDENEGYSAWTKRMENDLGAMAKNALAPGKEG